MAGRRESPEAGGWALYFVCGFWIFGDDEAQVLAAEIAGKIPSGVKRLEDVLTSHVFGFLRYSGRALYLRSFLKEALDIGVSAKEAELAKFQFWPTYPDGSEPDVVIVVGRHYLLFEAKLHSPLDQRQLRNELQQGRAAAERERKDFSLIAVTAHSCEPREELRSVGPLRWTNWQQVASMIVRLIEHHGDELPDRDLAEDLLDVLDGRRLRGFRGFDEIPVPSVQPRRGRLFLQAETMDYRGDFIGFPSALMRAPAPKPPTSTLFFSQRFFVRLGRTRRVPAASKRVFYAGS